MCLGQILLARRMGKTRIIAETGAGQHGVATATACARFGLECVVYMGAVDVERQKPNVFRMNMLGAKVVPVQSGAQDPEGCDERGLARLGHQRRKTFYCIGTVAGPHPYPAMVRDFQSRDRRGNPGADPGCGRQAPGFTDCLYRRRLQRDRVVSPFLDDREIEIYGVEAAGYGAESCMPLRLPAASRACCTATAPIC